MPRSGNLTGSTLSSGCSRRSRVVSPLGACFSTLALVARGRHPGCGVWVFGTLLAHGDGAVEPRDYSRAERLEMRGEVVGVNAQVFEVDGDFASVTDAHFTKH